MGKLKIVICERILSLSLLAIKDFIAPPSASLSFSSLSLLNLFMPAFAGSHKPFK